MYIDANIKINSPKKRLNFTDDSVFYIIFITLENRTPTKLYLVYPAGGSNAQLFTDHKEISFSARFHLTRRLRDVLQTNLTLIQTQAALREPAACKAMLRTLGKSGISLTLILNQNDSDKSFCIQRDLRITTRVLDIDSSSSSRRQFAGNTSPLLDKLISYPKDVHTTKTARQQQTMTRKAGPVMNI